MATAPRSDTPLRPRVGPGSFAEQRRVQWAEDRAKLLRACRLLRMAIGFDRHPGGSLEDRHPPPPAWTVKALCLVAENELQGIDRTGVAEAVKALGARNALAALMNLEEFALRLRQSGSALAVAGDPTQESVPLAP